MVLSIHPRHIANILSGDKTVELRRTRPTAQPGQPVALYATAPTSAVVATCIITSITTDSPAIVKERALAASRIDEEEYDRYFAKSGQAVAISLSEVVALPNPITLTQLRKTDRWHPPQTWHFMPWDRLLHVVGKHPSLAQLGSLL